MEQPHHRYGCEEMATETELSGGSFGPRMSFGLQRATHGSNVSFLNKMFFLTLSRQVSPD